MANYDKELTFALGQLLRSARERRRLNLRQLQDLSKDLGCEISRSMVSRYERGDSRVPEETLSQLCEIYGVDQDALLEDAYSAANSAYAVESALEEQLRNEENKYLIVMFSRLSVKQRKFIISIMEEMLGE